MIKSAARRFLKDFWSPDRSSDDLIDEGVFKAYWRAYGGARALIYSPYLYISLFLSLPLIPLWVDGGMVPIALNILPSLLGFSIGALAIVIAFPGAALMKEITRGGRIDSTYLEVVSKLVHFILVQLSGVFFGLLAHSYKGIALFGFSAFLTIYSMSVLMAAAMSMFGLEKVYNYFSAFPETDKDPCKEDQK